MLLTIAQTSYAKPNSRSGFWVRPTLSGGITTLTETNLVANGYKATPQVKETATVGVDFGGMFNDHVGLFAGVHYTSRKYEMKFSTYNAYLSMIGEMNYTEIPFYFRFITSNYRRLGYFMDIGFSTGFLSGCKTTAEGRQNGKLAYYDEEKGNKERLYQNISVTPTLYLGFNIPAGARLDINVGPQVSYQSTNLFDDATNDYGTPLNGHFFNFELKAAFGIKCTR